MTTITAAAAGHLESGARDPRRFNRRSLALLAPVAPALVAVLRLVMPYDTADSTRAMVAKVAAHQGRQSAVVILATVALLVVVPGYLGVARLTRRRAPVLTTIGLALAVAGYVGLAMTALVDQILLSAAKIGLDAATTTRLLAHVNGSVMATVGGTVFVAGHVLGTILIGVAMLRSRAVPAWAAAAAIASQPIHVLSAVVVTNHPLDFVGWGLLAVGFAVAARRLWALDDADWDLAPAPAAG